MGLHRTPATLESISFEADQRALVFDRQADIAWLERCRAVLRHVVVRVDVDPRSLLALPRVRLKRRRR